MSGYLALVGDRPFTEGCSFDAELLEASGTAEVLVMPTAAAYEHPDRRIDEAAEWFGALGAKVVPAPILDRPAAMDESWADTVRAARFVYLTGNSPMHLRSVLKESPVWDALLEAWHDGAVLAASGGSAMTLCDPMVDPRGGAFTVGLGLLAQVAVVAQSGWSADQAKRTIELAPAGVPVVAIDARAAIVRSPDGSWRRAGSGDVLVYVDRAERDLDALPG